MPGILGGAGLRGELVCGRLDAFVSPTDETEREGLTDTDWVKLHSDKVRDCLKGSAKLAERLRGESDEPEPELERQPERVLKGEAFMVKMLEQLRRDKRIDRVI